MKDLEKFLSLKWAQNERNDSALIKSLADGSNLFVAHTTWLYYQFMLRVMKKYKFAFKSFED